MASSISAGTTSSTGLVATADTSGALVLQTNNGTTAITLDTSQNATFVGYANLPNTFGFKNRIINGAMVIDQRNAGASITNLVGNLFSVDRWGTNGSQASKFTVQQNAGSVTPPTGYRNYLGVTSSSAYTVGSTEAFYLYQGIEGFNTYDLAWGTANAQSITLSFWVRSSLTGTFGGSLFNDTANYSYPFSYTISAINTWEQKTITIAGPTAGTWTTNNTVGIWISLNIGAGSTLLGTANTWAGSFYRAPTGATSIIGTNAATFYITGIQLEKSSIATSFDYRSYGTELALCLRYYQTLPGIIVNPAASWVSITYVTPMRANPTVSGGGGGFTIDTASVYVGNFYQSSRAAQTITLSAEL